MPQASTRVAWRRVVDMNDRALRSIANSLGGPGNGFLVFVCGDIMTMPGLPRVPAADKIRIDDAGLIQGLF